MAKPRAIGYVRVSTREQAAEGYGLEAQEKAIRGYCRDAGLRVVRVERDEGESGSNGLDTRQGLARALRSLEGGEADVLVVKRLDRVARDLLVQETVMGRLRQHGRGVLSVEEPDIDSEDATRVLVRQVLGAIAQYERAVIRDRVNAGKAIKAAAGGYTGGRPPYGKRADGGALVEDPEEAKVLALVHRLSKRGVSYRQIVRELEAKGYEPRGKAQRWYPNQVRRIAQAPR